MKKLIHYVCLLLLIILLLGCATSVPPINREFSPIIKFGKISSVMLAYVSHQNYQTLPSSEKSGKPAESKLFFPDGLVFYFFVLPENKNI
jgi:hypothetical protein